MTAYRDTHEMREHLEYLQDENAAYRLIVYALPHTRDDKPIVPGMAVYTAKEAIAYTVTPFHGWENPTSPYFQARDKRGAPIAICAGRVKIHATDCYSTPEAAEAAREQQEAAT